MGDSMDPERRAGRGMIGFYASCTVFGAAITITAVAWIAFGEMDGMAALGWVAAVFAAVSAAATWYFLSVARRER